ncbi:MAG TPA: ABC transporter permease [Candidatus Krumholzibacteria bacterium]|nr:ABC transporter permease [Candidatus Krumholzibacteria bacterium]
MSAVARPVAVEWLYEFVRYRELFFFLVWRDVKIRYKQTILGAAWAIIQPFALMVVATFAFGRAAGIDSEGAPYPVFAYAALVPWAYFQYSVPLAGNSLISNSNLISKVYFPRAIIPASSTLSGIVDFAVASVMLVALIAYYRLPLTIEMLMWPVLLVPMIIFTTAVGMLFAALNVKFRDIKYTIPFFIQSMMFLSPVFYPPSIVPEKWAFLLHVNPLVGILDSFRASILPGRTIDWASLGVASAVSVVLFALAAVYFYRTERTFADLI